MTEDVVDLLVGQIQQVERNLSGRLDRMNTERGAARAEQDGFRTQVLDNQREMITRIGEVEKQQRITNGRVNDHEAELAEIRPLVEARARWRWLRLLLARPATYVASIAVATLITVLVTKALTG